MAGMRWYAQSQAKAYQGNIKIGTNAIKAAWFKSTYTPNYATDALYSAIIGNESSGSGYTAGGAAVTSPAVAVTAANSWATAAAVTTAYAVGQIVRPATGNGFLYYCEAAGTSGGSAPTWPTVEGATVADGTVTWTNLGTAIMQFTGTMPTWTMTCTDFQKLVFYDTVTSALICCFDSGNVTSITSQLVTVTADATGIAYQLAA